jgi:hypothetical protein
MSLPSHKPYKKWVEAMTLGISGWKQRFLALFRRALWKLNFHALEVKQQRHGLYCPIPRVPLLPCSQIYLSKNTLAEKVLLITECSRSPRKPSVTWRYGKHHLLAPQNDTELTDCDC